MSRNHKKISKALEEKGYITHSIEWESIGGAAIMCGNSGGWYIDFEPMNDMELKQGDEWPITFTIMAYNITEVMEEIKSLPTLQKII